MVRDLRESGTSLAAISPTADREETSRFVEQLDKLKNDISERQKLRNHAYVRMKKNEQLRRELGSLNREAKNRFDSLSRLWVKSDWLFNARIKRCF